MVGSGLLFFRGSVGGRGSWVIRRPTDLAGTLRFLGLERRCSGWWYLEGEGASNPS